MFESFVNEKTNARWPRRGDGRELSWWKSSGPFQLQQMAFDVLSIPATNYVLRQLNDGSEDVVLSRHCDQFDASLLKHTNSHELGGEPA